MTKKAIGVFFLVCFFWAARYAFAVTPGQEMSGQVRDLQMQQKEKELREKVEEKAKTPEIQEELPAPAALPESQEKTLIKQINVTGVTFLAPNKIQDIATAYQGKELTLRDMQKVADLVTDAYRQAGFITSRAYLPPQKIENGILEIRVVEGLMGDLNITGNRYFKTAIFKRKMSLEKGEAFDYNKLRANLSKINQYPDRSARAVLVPGKETGTTDVTLEVKDRLPIHIGFDWDNFGSRYVEKDRYQATLTHNNLIGFDDSLTFQYQVADADAYRLTSLRYLVPVRETTEIGFFAARTKLELGREFEAAQARGKSRLFSLYATQDLISKENLGLSLRFGFDYKDIINFENGDVSSRDLMRVFKTSFDLDVSDRFGRTIIDNEINFGIPDIMGGLADEDSRASRVGSGGQFVKNTLTVLRVQKMPLSSKLLWKNQLQFASNILTAAEQFQLGGIANLRGYPPAELVGDNGFTTTLEWSFPPYFIPKNIQVPFSKAKWYDALRIVTFYDWGSVRLRNPQVGEEKSENLSDLGCGLRFTLPEDFSVRIDIGWPLGDKTPSDKDHCHPWFQVSKEF